MIAAMISFTNLCLAAAMIESGGDANAVNRKHGAYGPLQIRQMCLADLNKHYGTKYQLYQFVGNMPLSRWAFEAYGKMYGCATADDFVRCWHWGPRGRWEQHPGDDYAVRVMNMYSELMQKEPK